MRLIRYSYPSFRSVAPAFPLYRRSPWGGLESEIDRLFDTALTDLGRASTNRFPVDLYEDETNTYVRAELPGISREDISVELADGTLTINAARKVASTDGKPEESFTLSRSVNIADDVQADHVAATYENGVLTVTLPKREEVKPKTISVTVK